ncbi:MAG: hypothetical protein KatS3mg015_2407 [Fimbriimonadales bacterium]|nr:MAG: hypothetical protein KatS3mg015_2407 [Fimbriimonadales bacterium]
MRGERSFGALTTRRLLTTQFLVQFLRGYLKGRDLKTPQRVEERLTAQARQLGGLRRGDTARCTPLDRGCKTSPPS